MVIQGVSVSFFDGVIVKLQDVLHSDVDAMESQASQLIHAALEQSPTSIADSKRAKSNKNLSMHSLTSSKNSAASSVHQYHFHGLASTQTQSYSDNEEDKGLIPNEGSQKENFESAKRNNGKDRQWTLPSPDWGPSPPQKSSSKDNTAKTEQSGPSRRPTKVYIERFVHPCHFLNLS